MEESKSVQDAQVPAALVLPAVSNEGPSVPPLTSSKGGVASLITSSTTTVTSSSASSASNSSPQHTKLPEPPPLIAVSNLTSSSFTTTGTPSNSKTDAGSLEKEKPLLVSQRPIVEVEKKPNMPSLVALEGDGISATITDIQKNQSTDSASSQEAPKKSEILSKKLPKVTSTNVGGLGAGKPKAFLAMMATNASSTPKKQARKLDPSSLSGSGGRGQGSKNRSPLSGSSTKKTTAEVVPSRSSNRNIKRPRTYEEEMDEMRTAAKASAAKKAKATSKVSKTLKKASTTAAAHAEVKDMGRWRPTDDLMLISAVQQTNDLSAVHLGVNFSCRFSLQEVEERWHALLYNPLVSQLAIEAIQGLHPGVVTMALNNALWSQEEEAVLAKIPPTDPGHLEKFQSVLRENPAVFHMCRTATSLHHHWVLMGHNNLLNTQKVDLIPPLESVKEFADAEDHLEDSELTKQKDVREEAIGQELVISDRHSKMEILKLEEELPMWRTVLETGSPPEFGPDDYALFKGKVVEFRMTKRTVVFGRSTACNTVDFDLSLEGPAFKVSRRQAMVQLTDSGDFMLHNEGRRPMYVSGKVLLSRTSTKLQHNQIIEIASLGFLVSLNLKMVGTMKISS